ncbi:hypothetical protein Moror_16540 [Moniliophthora roreri MCA 2997]|uniref:Uncharacterized protein n=1 Tax=Moniliophthora roreri (strain MCA 2997) TaxID=1381753 RepID=V2YGK5_MONRO|nr:hypothetical protein Moror_16540 [Moniliophthora roreri MCA 2997]KAI3616944.1 hypothetical protein WG66_004334 [Moniliophthora roreri]
MPGMGLVEPWTVKKYHQTHNHVQRLEIEEWDWHMDKVDRRRHAFMTLRGTHPECALIQYQRLSIPSGASVFFIEMKAPLQ